MFKYLKAAFLNRWNFLALIAGLGFGLLSGQPDVVIPLVLAGEAAYVGFAGSHPRFRQYVDVQQAQAQQSQHSQRNLRALTQMLNALPRRLHDRFDELRGRLLELQQIAADLKLPGQHGQPTALDSLQLAGLDRLLWIYLRLLFTHYSLGRFLQRTDVDVISNDADRIRNRLNTLDANDQSEHAQKIRHALEDNLQTTLARIQNYERAQGNFEFLELEIDRLENKINSLAEMAVNRQEPEALSGRVDEVATSMLDTEKTINELDFATGLGPLDEEAPNMLQPPVQIRE